MVSEETGLLCDNDSRCLLAVLLRMTPLHIVRYEAMQITKRAKRRAYLTVECNVTVSCRELEKNKGNTLPR